MENKNKTRMIWPLFSGRVLDIGCGANWLKKNTGGNVIGVDVSGNYDAKADCRKLPFKNESFDGIFAHHVVEHIPDPEKCFSEMNRVLKNGGIVYIEVPAEWNTESFYHPSHSYRFKAKEMRDMLESRGFNVVKLRYGAMEIEGLKNYTVYRAVAFAGMILTLFKKRRKVLRVVARKIC